MSKNSTIFNLIVISVCVLSIVDSTHKGSTDMLSVIGNIFVIMLCSICIGYDLRKLDEKNW